MTKRKVPKFMIMKPAKMHRVPVLGKDLSDPSETLEEKTNPEWTKKPEKETSVIDVTSFALFWDREKTPSSGLSASIAEDMKEEKTLEVEEESLDADLFDD